MHGEPGWDEATPCGTFALFDIRPGRVEESRRDPADYGLPRCAPEDLAGGDAEHNAAALEVVLRGEEEGAHRDSLLLSTGLLLEVTGQVRELSAGIEQARETVSSGRGATVLDRLREFVDEV